jgi:purine-nucleoside phosphorylase
MNMDVLSVAAQAVSDRLKLTKARCALILGSGWSDVAERFDLVDEIDYADIPGMGMPGVVGHAGRLRHCRLNGHDIIIFQGRRHWYEGKGWTPVALPVYVAAQLNVEMVLVTNAAGGISENLAPGDLMMLADHINFMGANPLIGAHHQLWGSRFPDQSEIYRESLRQKLRVAAASIGAELKEGVYIATSGPTYETPAEIRAYRAMGADAVGMSTVPEATLANAAGMQVAAISCITNYAAGVASQPLGHAEVLDTTRRTMPVMAALIYSFIASVCSD